MAYNGKYVSIERVIENVYRNEGYTYELNFIDAIEWVAYALSMIGAPQQYTEKVVNVDIEDYRGELPCDMHEFIMARDCVSKTPILYNTDAFRGMHGDDCLPDYNETAYIKSNFIFTKSKEGTVEVAYRAFETDDNGFPMIPDNDRVVKAVESYLVERIDHKLWRKGELADKVYKHSEQEWLWYVSSAQTALMTPDYAQMEAIKDNWIRLIPKLYQYSGGFKYINIPEHINLYGNQTRL